MAIGSGYTITRRPSIVPGRPEGGYTKKICPACGTAFVAEAENDKYCCMGCADKAKRARGCRSKEIQPRRKVTGRQFYNGQWRVTLECNHILFVPIAHKPQKFRRCRECEPEKL